MPTSGWPRSGTSPTRPPPPPPTSPGRWRSRCWSRDRPASARPSWPRRSPARPGADLVRLQCYEGLDEARALYEWNYKKQLLRIQAAGDQSWDETHDDIFTDEFLLTRPLLTAIRREEPTVLLIDEVDKTDVEVEGLLLEVLSDFQVTIPEMGTISAVRRPLVVLTSNATRELSEAIKRRCLFLHIDYPDAEREQEIVVSQVPEVEERAGRPDRRGGRQAARDGAAQGAVDRRDHRLGPHPGRARHRHPRRRGDRPDARRGAQARQRPRPGGPRAEAAVPVTLLDRHIEFVEALRGAGLPVSLAEGLDAVRAIDALGIDERETLRAAYAATLVKRQNHRPGFDQVFDLYFPLLIGDGFRQARPDGRTGSQRPRATDRLSLSKRLGRPRGRSDGPQALADFREALTDGDGDGRPRRAGAAGARGGPAVRADPRPRAGRAAVVVVQRDEPGLARRAGRRRCCRASGFRQARPATTTRRPRRLVEAQAQAFERLVDAEVRRRAAEVRGPQHVARHTVRPAIEQVDFTSARKADLELMRREIQPLARRLATRLSREQHARSRGPLDFRRTVRASMSSGGVPMETRHKPKRPGRTDLVVLCDVSGSVANFAELHADAGLRAARAVQPGAGVHLRRRDPRGHRPVRHQRRPGADDERARGQRAATRACGAAPTTAGRSPASPTSTPTRSPRRPTCWCSATPGPTTPTSRCPSSRTWCTPPGTAGGSTPSTRATGTPATRRPGSTAGCSRWSSAAT